MTIPEIYDYLMHARRDLWPILEATPDEVLSRPLLNGDAFHCMKDILFHIPAVEDGWLHEDILRNQPVRESVPALKDTEGGPAYATVPLETLLDFWQRVEQSTLAYMTTLTPVELNRVVALHDAPDERYTVDDLLWHIMTHEMRHAAQVSVLLRTQGIEPPFVDLLHYLPRH